MAQVIILAGGTSDEREISLRSGVAVAEALRQKGHAVKTLDPAKGMSGLLRKLRAADVVFPALHGVGGEDGVPQAFLEKHGIKYVGSDSRASALCFDKAGYTELLRENKLLVPDTKLVKYEEWQSSELGRRPFVLKPNNGGSSIDTFIVRDQAMADQPAIGKAFERHGSLLLQELIGGHEITVGILGSEALPVIEIIPPAGREFDYENKYNGLTQELCPPKNVKPEIQTAAQALALEIHKLTGCRDLSRTDFIVTPAGQIYTLETNTIPGLTGESLVPKAAGKAGYDMPEMCDKLIKLSLQRNT